MFRRNSSDASVFRKSQPGREDLEERQEESLQLARLYKGCSPISMTLPHVRSGPLLVEWFPTFFRNQLKHRSMALPPSSPRCEIKNESIDLLESRLPDSFGENADTLHARFQRCSPEISPIAAFPVVPTLLDELDIDQQIVSNGSRECSIEISSSPACFSELLNINLQPSKDASTRILKVECNTIGNISPFLVGISELADGSQQSYRTIKALEKPRKFPVPLSGENCVVVISNQMTAGFSSDGKLTGVHNIPRLGNGIDCATDIGSESEEDSYRTNPSSGSQQLSYTKDKLNCLGNDEGIWEPKIGELAVGSSGPSNVEDNHSKTVRARKRPSKEVVDAKEMETEYITLHRRCKQVNKETLYCELTKISQLRQKLESLCQELQHQNKMFMDESKRVTSKEERKRQELYTKFHDIVKDITAKLEDQREDRLQQLEENEMLHEKLEQFIQQYEIREKHFNHELTTKSLEQQLLEVKLNQQEELSIQAENKSCMYMEQVTQLLKIEEDLRSQLIAYGEKFQHFQETLTQSNKVYTTFKTELEKMSEIVKWLEKENSTLKMKCEESDASIIELLEERDILKKQLAVTKNQKEKLEGLFRTLQAKRKQQPIISLDTSNYFLPSQLEDLELSYPE